MTDLPAEKPSIARSYCPGCEPQADVLAEILDVTWCETHAPVRAGLDDELALVRGTTLTAEAGGDDNRRWCEMIHRETKRRASPRKRPSRPASTILTDSVDL